MTEHRTIKSAPKIGNIPREDIERAVKSIKDNKLSADEFNFLQRAVFCYCSFLTNSEIHGPRQISLFYSTNRVKAVSDIMDKLRGLTDETI